MCMFGLRISLLFGSPAWPPKILKSSKIFIIIFFFRSEGKKEYMAGCAHKYVSSLFVRPFYIMKASGLTSISNSNLNHFIPE